MEILIVTTNPAETKILQGLIKDLRIKPKVITPNEIDSTWLTQYQLIYIHPPISEPAYENTIKKIRNLNWYVPLLLPHIPKNEAQNILVIPKYTPPMQLAQVIYDIIKNPRKRAFKKLKYKDLTLDPHKRIAKRREKEFRLRNKEFGILEIMMENPGQTITKTELTEILWDRNATMLSNTLQVHISGLRQKIDKGFAKKLIHTIPCVGYRFGE